MLTVVWSASQWIRNVFCALALLLRTCSIHFECVLSCCGCPPPAAPTRFLQQQMNEKLLGLVVSSTVYWLLTQFPAGRSTALRRRRDFAIEVAALLPLPLSMRVQLNILQYLIENALELVLQLNSRRPQLLDCRWRSSGLFCTRLDSSISNEHLTITYLLASVAIPLQFLSTFSCSFFIAPTEVYHILCSSSFSNVRLIKANLSNNKQGGKHSVSSCSKVHSFKLISARVCAWNV